MAGTWMEGEFTARTPKREMRLRQDGKARILIES